MIIRAILTADQWTQLLGCPPINDDLERVACPLAGQYEQHGHWSCGWCTEHSAPAQCCLCWAEDAGCLSPTPAVPPHPVNVVAAVEDVRNAVRLILESRVGPESRLDLVEARLGRVEADIDRCVNELVRRIGRAE